MKIRVAAALAALTVCVSAVSGSAAAQVLPKATRDRIVQSTVMLMPTGADGKISGSLGSGSVISPAGYVLTNFHVVGDIESRKVSDWILIRTVKFVDREPEPTYWGRVVAADANLDLAVVRILETYDQKPVGALNLPFVELGDSNSLTVGDPLFVFGFPGTGGNTLTYTSGAVSGFTGENTQGSGRQWIKHDAQTGPGNSGGGVFDEKGLLIGVNSAVRVNKDTSTVTPYARPLAVAWGLITPNVPRFVVRGAGGTGGTGSGGAAASAPASAAPSGSGSASATPQPKWPPAIAPGQSYQVSIQRSSGTPKTESWALTLKDRASNGDPRGTATQGNQTQTGYVAYDEKADLVWIDLTRDGKAMTSCAFEVSGLRTSPWVGRAFYFKDIKGQPERIGDCQALVRTGAAPAASGNAAPAPSGGAASTAGALKWPVKPAVGQTWTLDVQGRGVWTLPLTALSEKGSPRGTAQTSSGQKWTAYYYYLNDSSGEGVILDMTADGKTYIGCEFTKSGLSGRSLRGKAYLYASQDDKQGTEAGTCVATLK
ncbi:S1C family serine protease [Deinococcus marmoris]|uniref:S1C family serine protease n=1 Tax=Deinococcus marmoris TaxID=249408 RepID=UPI000A4AD268|nr:serine protease [Deinococcus marmoris]